MNHLYRGLVVLFIAGPIWCLPQSQTSNVCDENGLCFQQFQFADNDMTVGIALPPLVDPVNATSKELIAKVAFMLPYGFAGFTMDGSGVQNTATMTQFVDFANNAAMNPPPTLANARVQLSHPLPNNTLAPFGDALVTISNQTAFQGNRASFIFRCQNCAVAGEPAPLWSDVSHVTLTAMISNSTPQYLDASLIKANLPLAGTEMSNFVLNLNAARFANYSAIVAAAGF